MAKFRKRPNGHGCVHKLQGKRRKPWVATLKGKTIGTYATRREAELALDKLINKDLPDVFNFSFSDVYDAWSKDKFSEIGDASIKRYEHAFRVFAPLHNKKMRDLKLADYQSIIDAYPHRGKSTVQGLRDLVTGMCSWAMAHEIIDRNYGKMTRSHNVLPEQKHVPYTQSEIDAIKADGSYISKLIYLLACTGMRDGELLAMTVMGCHAGYMVGGLKTEAGRNRTIVVLEEGLDIYNDLKNEAIANGQNLLCSISRTQFYSMYHDLAQRIGTTKTPHSARSYFLTKLSVAGVPQEIQMQLVGHASYSVTAERYLGYSPDELRKAVSNI